MVSPSFTPIVQFSLTNHDIFRFIFTTILLLATLRSTVAFFFLFFTLDMAFLMLALGYYEHGYVALKPASCDFLMTDLSGKKSAAGPNENLNKAGGVFGILAAFAAWYNALAGILEPSNSFFLIPVLHFPWSVKGREDRGKDGIGKVVGMTENPLKEPDHEA